MSNHRDLSLDKYEISKFAYRELLNFCRQYPEKKARLIDLRSLSVTPPSGMPRGSSVSNPTERKATLAARLSLDCELIEQTAIEAAGAAYPWLLDGVTSGYSYQIMNMPQYRNGQIPVCKNTYHAMRRRFYWLLAIKKGVI